MSWWLEDCAEIDRDALDAARQRQDELTKPVGSLGELENIATLFAGWQGTPAPSIKNICVRVFVGDHGIARQGVSAFPQAVTQQMISNFVCDGAAISVLAQQLSADFRVLNMGTVDPVPDAHRLRQVSLMAGTRDFSREMAMPESIAKQALLTGREEVETFNGELFIGGEMGIGNTTSAAALVCAITGKAAELVVGRGTGIDDSSWKNKCILTQTALDLHQPQASAPMKMLAAIGGLEIAALAGAYIGCAQRGIPVLLDGFISTAAAMVACQLNGGVRSWILAGHQSVEPGHTIALEHLGLTPLLRLNMRLGEGSGAATAVPIIQSALQLHNEMATFAEAGVSAAN